MAARAAASRINEGAHVISQMQDGEAVFSVNAAVQLDSHPYLRVDMRGGHVGLGYFLFWRTLQTPGRQNFAPLEGAGNGPSWHRFPDPELWQGTTSTLAVGAFGTDSGAPITLHELSFQGASRRAFLESAWTAWHANGSWSGSAINRYLGAPKGSDQLPAALIGLWAALALVFVVAWAYLRRPSRRALMTAGLLAIFLPWLLLDRLWQAQLDRQLLLTRDVFAGRTQAEKRSVEIDAHLYNYAQHIRGRLALAGARVFLLHASSGHNFDRLRLQFHLLPVNVYNYGDQLLAPGDMRRGDYLLTLGTLPQFRYSAQTQLLSDGRHVYHAQLVDTHSSGNLYLLKGYAGAADTP